MPRPPSPPPKAWRPKRALSGLQRGPIATTGEATTAELLGHALDTGADEALAELTHGFHSYPARFHPLLARRLLAATPGARRVLDPFVGSGTTLVEAGAARRQGFGVDINPLAVALSRLKATAWSEADRGRLLATAQAIATRSDAAVRASRRRSAASAEARPETRYDDPRHYPPHVFRELVGLRQEIAALAQGPLLEPLLLVLSSIVVKVSLQRSDTDESVVERTVARGAATRLFLARAEELVRRLAAFARLAAGGPSPDVRIGDARRLVHLEGGSIDLVITSPPYLGTYDYARHHARRFGWLGYDPTRLAAVEIGARRLPALARWQQDVAAYLAEIARVLAPGGTAFLLVGDSAAGAQAVRGDEALRQAGAAHRLVIVASASQERPDVYAPARAQLPEGRREHLLALRHR